eukprot:6423618-Amphidinium_carterae.1
MEGFDNPRFNMSRQPQASNSGHGLLKSAHMLLLNRVAPAGPLSIHTKIPGGDLHWREETGAPGLPQLSFGVRAIADDNRFLG